MTEQQIMDTHPSFRQECVCDTRTIRITVVQKYDNEPRVDDVCAVCVEQMRALGYTVTILD